MSGSKLLYVVIDVVAGTLIHSELTHSRCFGIYNEYEGSEHLTLFLFGSDGNGLLSVLSSYCHVVGCGNVLTVYNCLEHLVESSELLVLLTVGNVFLSAHAHRKLSAVHDKLFLVAVGRNANVLWFADGYGTGSHLVGREGCLMTGTSDCLCCAK